jgi:hypothetical protein
VVRTEAQKAAWDNGYRLERGIDGGWLRYGSTTAPGSAWIAGATHAAWRQAIRTLRSRSFELSPDRIGGCLLLRRFAVLADERRFRCGLIPNNSAFVIANSP